MVDPQVKNEHTESLPEVSSTFHPAFGTFMVPSTVQNHMVLQPLGTPYDEPRGFSTQFMSPGDLGSYSFLTLSPVNAVDPSLRGYGGVGVASPSPARPNIGLRSLSNLPVCHLGTTLSQNLDSGPQLNNDQDSNLDSHGRDNYADNYYSTANSSHHSRPRTTQNRKYTKRYQYWTQQEDNLVFSLRQRFGWTWKEISSELQRRLGGEHTWQAVQMRYLRTRKNRVPDSTLNDEGPLASKRRRGSQDGANFEKPATNVDVDADYNEMAARLERAIQADWQGRWERIGAATGIELDSRAAKKALSNTKLPIARRYIE